ncbi:MAG TPA: hypothetical protein VJ976_03915 [Ornithinimicrobium sp.]|uniref:hypothetical protein n=1 Tax=Ornithinimicrobium sp. TaxID=1977084 RepID=UPI002B469479|nr:hypothetical protein [Ornithinimicrobium sp.]HKJ11519.1 hypothetical protein [Ornithinimicrobium sp.]
MSSTPNERGYDEDSGDRTQRVPQSERTSGGGYYDDRDRDRESFGRDIDREREAHGGIKWGAAFFGWLTAVGTAVFLATAAAAAGALVDALTNTDLQAVTDEPEQAGVVGLVAAVVVLIIVNVCGGYVAGRMARFDGGRQGVGVWIWTLVMGAIVAALSVFLGSRFDVAAQLPAMPSGIPLIAGDPNVTGIVAGAVALLVALFSAVIGGKMGMRFHRKVDRY